MEPSNPTISEIEAWAWSYTDQNWPHSEWPLFLTWTREIELFIALAKNQKCPKKDFFLFLLYYIVGFTYSYPKKDKKEVKREVKEIISNGRGIKQSDILKWVKHSEELLGGKLEYTYEDWRGRKLAGYKFT
jgi:hypothetical protein